MSNAHEAGHQTPFGRRGPWTHRFLVGLFGLLLGVLVYWLLGFVVKDIGSWPGPNYSELEKRLVDKDLLGKEKGLGTRLADFKRNIAMQEARQVILRDGTSSSERTMNQLLELQKLSLQKGVALSDSDAAALAESKQLFLSNQKEYQRINEQIAHLTDQVREVEAQQREVDGQLRVAREAVTREYARLETRHQLRLAAFKLATLAPLLVVAAWLFLKRRSSLYSPMIYAFGIAVAVKVGWVMHQHFPRRYFKYVLILLAIAAVGRALVYLLRMMAFPKTDWLLRQYREAYERFFCPVCGYPIRRGPMKYLFWTPRSIKKMNLPAETRAADEPYSCPFCGARLFEPCPACQAVRHSLLPVCSNCGAEKSLDLGAVAARKQQ